MSSHEFEKSVSDSRQRWEDDGGSIPPDHSDPTRSSAGCRVEIPSSRSTTASPIACERRSRRENHSDD